MILANVRPSEVVNESTDKSKLDCVVNVFEDEGLGTLGISLNDCVATTRTLNSVAPPLVKPPKPNNSLSADELIFVEPPLLESKSTE